MASLYNLEPQPTAKVLLRTTAGDLLLELFAKQTPRTSRNFLQLCLDGYYDNTIFHRLVPGFVIQGGDPTGTGQGGESSYDGEPFADEFHSRLKFNRRGLLGMANTGTKDDNGSQFFLTLGATPELTGVNTMFGRIEGETIYNLMKMGEADLTEEEGSERPLYPTKVTGTDIIVNYFDDMVKRTQIAQPQVEEKKGPKKVKRKAAKQLLSFGADVDDADVAPVAKKPKFNTKLVSAGPEDAAAAAAPPKPKPAPKARAASPKPLKKRTPSPSPPPAPAPKPSEPQRATRSPSPSTPSSASASPEPLNKMDTLLSKTNAQIASLKASMKRSNPTASAAPAKPKSALEAMIPATATRGRKRKGGGTGSAADQKALDLFNAFKSKLDSAPAEAPAKNDAPTGAPVPAAPGPQPADAEADAEAALCDLHFIANCQSCRAWTDGPETAGAGGAAGEKDDDDAGWMGHALTFEKDRLGKDLEWKRRNEEELVVIDPREREKEIVGERGKKGRGKEREREKGRK
ncbi:uncharacterized protein K452DRAFT_286405 [Aplosporella prunicola CBS 121167]|uniref:PPIase cyclophilin-type domain-containing protein n=1 Tax=Aplosporella prunicola CBS 121167 TaxID=1176127 RepID=A0A6A6BF35_9PEZI|nr:uncharacterized protein K452DRAFT_286405 [Aplosporella prunicola CBS 121167]KAF2142779.1 hypothetical protein K452DRAFT_286405 [Aplosporella prunicola CBS 121167]